VGEIDGVPHLVRHHPGEASPFLIVGTDARSAEDHPRLQHLRCIVRDPFDVGDPQDGGGRNAEEVRENGPVVVVDDVDPASVEGSDDRGDVRGVHIAQTDGGEVSRDHGPEARSGDARPLGCGPGHQPVGLLIGKDSQRAQAV
jgi:hypothetical protein